MSPPLCAAAKRLAETCWHIARQTPAWTQGAGGNVSVKDGDNMWIKASGSRLKDVGDTQSIACVSRKKMLVGLDGLNRAMDSEQAYADLLATLADPMWGRPSMETGMHAVLPWPWVIHFHAISALLMGYEDTRQPGCLDALFAEYGLRLCCIGACRPGLALVQALDHAGDADAIILKNHGIVLAAQSHKILETWRVIELAFVKHHGFFELESVLTSRAEVALSPQKWRILYPDAAVFAERIEAMLHATGDNNLQIFDAKQKNRHADLYEMWQATCLILQARPNYPSLAQDIARTTVDLPTERVRTRRFDENPDKR